MYNLVHNYDKSRPKYYQYAELVDGVLQPIGSSLLKWNIIQKAAQLLKRPFTFGDFGCAEGLFGLLLYYHYGATGDLISYSDTNVQPCMEVVNYCKQNIKFIKQDAMTITNKYDLTLYISLVHHFLRHGHSPQQILDTIIKQTNSIAIVEIPTQLDKLAIKALKDKMYLLEDLKALLITGFTVIDSCEWQYPNRHDVKRECYILAKK